MTSTTTTAWEEFEKMLRGAEAGAGTVASDFIAAVPHSDRAKRIDQLAGYLQRAQMYRDELDIVLKTANAELARMTDEVAGKHELEGEAFLVSVTRREKFEWDNEELLRMFAAGSMPAYCALRITINKKAYDRMSATEKADLAPALTISLTTPKVEVTTK